jgi:uncharacterized protein DUF6448
MRRSKLHWAPIIVAANAALVLAVLPRVARAHCDTLDGPVVKAAKVALDRGDVTPVLRWVKKEHEAEVREAFEDTLRVRATGPEARHLADRYFFETVVRLHRDGEGEPYTGLKPAGTDPGAAARGADQALEQGSVDPLVKLLTDEVTASVRERFALARDRQARAGKSVEAGREFVAAYVEFVHYAERVHADATGTATSHEADTEAGAHSSHEK